MTDRSGGVIPGVEVTAVNKQTNVASKAVTNERGDYIVDKIRSGVFDVGAEQPGFKKQVFAGVRLETGQYGRVDFVLTPGGIAESGGRLPVDEGYESIKRALVPSVPGQV